MTTTPESIGANNPPVTTNANQTLYSIYDAAGRLRFQTTDLESARWYERQKGFRVSPATPKPFDFANVLRIDEGASFEEGGVVS